ncbi:hypothetical protein KBC04_04055 [Candidatus Babeliales bacterium]|nr:hypothetical protein [Candidatus Babeliales bacterium]MBP9843330.1 hypothetical protein [Candidatus Babeliales bacterium]
MKKIVTVMACIFTMQELYSISSFMSHRVTSSSPLLYKVMDYSEQQLSVEFEPWVGGMFDPAHTIANLAPQGTSDVRLDQLGHGDMNPQWIYLGNQPRDYASVIELTPEISMFGLLFDFYKQFEYWYFDVKTALMRCKTNINITEVGGGNGKLESVYDQPIYDAYGAFTQTDWKYGKLGQENTFVGLDDIQVTVGSVAHMHSFSNDRCATYFSGFGLVEVPTGKGTQAEWLMEPLVGTNHWGLGFGADVLVLTEKGFGLTFGGNYRYLFSAWETRSFDLVGNGPWSRYLAVQLLADQNANSGLPGINLFTQDALIDGNSQITMYARFQKKFVEGCLFEFGYNYFYTQAQRISDVTTIAPGYGILDMNSMLGGSGVTASHAQINQAYPSQDLSTVELVTSDLDLNSGAAGAWASSLLAARLQRMEDGYNYGIGGSVEMAHSAQAISSWSVWLNFEILV